MLTYDHIIIGAGASGLLLANTMGEDPYFKGKQILIIDKGNKTKNDRTWCFWEAGQGPFDNITHQTWPKIHFASEHLNFSPKIAPYSYKMLRGIDFYQSYLKKLQSYPNIKFIQDEIESVEEERDIVLVRGKNNAYTTRHAFDSRFRYQELKQQSKYPLLQQHFLGWFVKTDRSVFDKETATFMDFSIPQKSNTRFMYVLPFSDREALVEYTLFSADLLKKSEYEGAIIDYLKNLGVENYEITATERGNIPMTCYDFTQGNSNQVLKIGIAGGWAKASTGFTFYRSSKQVKRLVAHLKSGKPLKKFQKKNRYWLYDLLFLDVLHQNNHLGSKVFESLFKKRSPQLVLKFLDEETTFWEDLKVMWACPKLPFITALFKRLF